MAPQAFSTSAAFSIARSRNHRLRFCRQKSSIKVESDWFDQSLTSLRASSLSCFSFSFAFARAASALATLRLWNPVKNSLKPSWTVQRGCVWSTVTCVQCHQIWLALSDLVSRVALPVQLGVHPWADGSSWWTWAEMGFNVCHRQTQQTITIWSNFLSSSIWSDLRWAPI